MEKTNRNLKLLVEIPSPPSVPIRIPSLDGVRAASISLVILGHLVGTTGFPVGAGALSHIGNFGVRCFFVISGFLITTLLLREWHANGNISISRFYLRRSLRIFPACYFFILVMFLAWQFGWIEVESREWLHAATYTMNYMHDGTWNLSHLWSLSAEEQFYLLWPGVLVVVGLRRGIILAAIIVITVPFIRWSMWTHNVAPTGLVREFQAMADSLACGSANKSTV